MTATLAVHGLGVVLHGKHEARVLLRDVHLTVASGESVGLVGESGSGKSTTARAVLRALPPHAAIQGEVRLLGQDVLALDAEQLRSMRAGSVALIGQNPRTVMNPLRTVGDFATEALRTVRKVPRRRATADVAHVLEETGIESAERVLALYPHQLSGGMLQRVVIATAVVQEPELIIADEPTSGLDVSTQADVMKLLTHLQRSRGMSMLFITHNLDLAAASCDRTAVMYAGSVVEDQPSRLLHTSPRHPYTSGLLGARTRPDLDLDRLAAIPGRPIAAYEAGPGCAFAPRCAHARPRCSEQPPVLTPTAEGSVACLRHEELTLPPGPTEPPANAEDRVQAPSRECV